MKSERQKKLETELEDLKQWLKLGLVPKKDLEKHQSEIHQLQMKIEEEKERIRIIKESGEPEDYTIPKKSQALKPVYQDADSIPDIDEEDYESDSFSLSSESDEMDASSLFGYEEEGEENSESEEDDEDPFSDRNRWKRGVLEDPEVDNW